MGRGLSRAASLIEGFNAMYDTIGRVQRDRELANVAGALPTMDQGFTPGQAAQIQSAANSGQYDIEWDEASKGYKITPKAGGAPGMINMQQRQTFMGEVQDTPMDAAAVSRARRMAMAGVLERHGDLDRAGALRREIEGEDDRKAARALAAKREGREDERWRRDQEQYDAEKAYREGMGSVIDGSVFGQRTKAFQEQMGKYEAEKKAYDAKVAAGDSSAVAPTMPQQPTMTTGEKLLDAAQVVAFKAKHGKASPEEIMKVSEMMTAVGNEGYLNMLRSAQAGAPLTAVVQAFNSTGKAQIDPSAIVKDERVKRPGGVESRLITYRLPDGRTQTIDTYAELAGLGKAEDVLKQAQVEHQQRMAEGNLKVSQGNLAVHQADAGRRAAEFRAGATERDAKAEIAKLKIQLAQTEDPAEQQRLEAKLRALSTGSRAGGGGGPGADPAKVKEARELIATGAAPDMATALEAINGRAERAFQSYVDRALKDGVSEEVAVARARRMMRATGHEERAGRWVKTGFPGITPPEGAIRKLKDNPGLASKFDEKYGPGSAARALAPSDGSIAVDGWGGALR